MNADRVSGLVDMELSPRQVDGEFTAWCRKSQASLYRWAMFLGADRELAKDVLQDSLIKIWSVWAVKRTVVLSTPAYAKQVVRNALYDHYRACASRPQTVGGLDLEECFPAGSSEQECTDERTRQALARLEPRYQEILFLIYSEGLKPGEAAAQMQIAPGTAHNYHLLAKRAFEAEYEALAR